jgi:hypothetical protein
VQKERREPERHLLEHSSNISGGGRRLRGSARTTRRRAGSEEQPDTQSVDFLSQPLSTTKMQSSLQRHHACAGFLSQGQAAIDARPSLTFIREQMSKSRDQGQATRVSVVPQTVLPGKACQQLDVRRREKFQSISINSDRRSPGATLLPEVRLESGISLSTIHAQMAMGRAQLRQSQQPPTSQQVGPVQQPSSQQVGPVQPTEAQLARASQGNDDRPLAEARAHVVEEDDRADGAGIRRSHQEAC